MAPDPEKSEEKMVDNYFTDTLYSSREFKGGVGKFFTIVSKDENNIPNEIDIEHSYPIRNKIKTTLKFIKKENGITAISFKRFKYYTKEHWVEQPEEQITFSYNLFKKIIGHLQLLSELNLSDISERRISLSDNILLNINDETKKKIKTLLSSKDGQKIIEELINNGLITSTDIINIGYRKKQLEIFEKLLNQPGYFAVYTTENKITDTRHESIWQHFFNSNDWIFGYGLDYRFLGILQKEARVSNLDIAGKGAVINDFLLGCNKFTVLVELKKHDTPLFSRGKNRSNSWILSDDLISGLSQILEQKASWQVFAETNANGNFDDKGKLIKQKTVDPKSILVIGSTKQFDGGDKENQIKAKTFELFRRDSRNIEILTYDELYERAKFIIEHRKKDSTQIKGS
ncbi:MAG: Shedu immune nuclease family protein [Patescibacteria group bacterium]